RRAVAEQGVDRDVVRHFVPHYRRARTHRVLGMVDAGQDFVIDHDRLCGVERLRHALRQHHGDRLADVAGLVRRQQQMRADEHRAAACGRKLHVVSGLRQRIRRDGAEAVGEAVGAGENAEHARHRLGARGIDGADAGMRVRRAHHHRMCLAGEAEIVAEAAVAGGQPLVLLAHDRLADEAEAGISHRLFDVRHCRSVSSIVEADPAGAGRRSGGAPAPSFPAPMQVFVSARLPCARGEPSMPYQDFRQFLDVLRQHGELLDVNRPVALADVGKAMKQSYVRQGPALMFNQNGTDYPLVAGVYSTRSKALLAFEADEDTIFDKVLTGLDRPIAPIMLADKPPCQEEVVTGDDIDIRRWPIPTYSPKDGGAYITPGIVVSADPETGVPDIGHYRFLILGRDTFSFSAQPFHRFGKHLAKHKRLGTVPKAALVIGVDPILAYTCQVQVPDDTNDWN